MCSCARWIHSSISHSTAPDIVTGGGVIIVGSSGQTRSDWPGLQESNGTPTAPVLVANGDGCSCILLHFVAFGASHFNSLC